MKHSAQEIRAAAEAAITARQAADAAKKAWEDAGSPSDGDVKTAYDTAEQAATTAKGQADALSQDDGGDDDRSKKVSKLKRRAAIVKRQLEELGESNDDEDDDEGEDDDDEDLDKPLTRRDLQRMQVREASQTATQMADAIEDAVAKQAVKDALKRIVPSGDAQRDFTDAVALANREKNSKILEEIGRKTQAPQHRSSAGAPAKTVSDTNFEPTAEEAAYMRPPFNLSKEEIIAARNKAQG